MRSRLIREFDCQTPRGLDVRISRKAIRKVAQQHAADCVRATTPARRKVAVGDLGRNFGSTARRSTTASSASPWRLSAIKSV
jgi:hypothetical protein